MTVPADENSWQSPKTVTGKLSLANCVIETGVAAGGRALMQIEALNWIDDWFGASLQLVGNFVDTRPAMNRYAFGNISFPGGPNGISPAPSILHTAARIEGKDSVGVSTEPFVPTKAKPEQKTRDRVIKTTVSANVLTVAFVLWLESNQQGYIKSSGLNDSLEAFDLNL